VFFVCLERTRSAVHAPVHQVEQDVGAGEHHARVGVDGVGVLDDPEAAESFLLGAPRGLVVQGEMHHHALLFFRRVLGANGGPRVARQAVGVRLAVRAVHHHGSGVGHAAGARELRLGEKRGGGTGMRSRRHRLCTLPFKSLESRRNFLIFKEKHCFLAMKITLNES